MLTPQSVQDGADLYDHFRVIWRLRPLTSNLRSRLVSSAALGSRSTTDTDYLSPLSNYLCACCFSHQQYCNRRKRDLLVVKKSEKRFFSRNTKPLKKSSEVNVVVSPSSYHYYITTRALCLLITYSSTASVRKGPLPGKSSPSPTSRKALADLFSSSIT